MSAAVAPCGSRCRSVSPWAGDTDALFAALGISGSRLPVEAYVNGPTHVYVVLASKDEVGGLRPDIGRLAEVLRRSTISCVAGDGTNWKSRVFGPDLGVIGGSRDRICGRSARRPPVPPRCRAVGHPDHDHPGRRAAAPVHVVRARAPGARISWSPWTWRAIPSSSGAATSSFEEGTRHGHERPSSHLGGLTRARAARPLDVTPGGRPVRGPGAPHGRARDPRSPLHHRRVEAVPHRARRSSRQAVRRPAGERRHRRDAALRRLGPRGAARRHGHRRRRGRGPVPVDRDDARAVEGPRLPDRVHPRVQRLARRLLCRRQGPAHRLGDDPDHRSGRGRRRDRAGRRPRVCAARWFRAYRPTVITRSHGSIRCGLRSRMRTGRSRSTSSPARAAAIPRSARGSGCSP